MIEFIREKNPFDEFTVGLWIYDAYEQILIQFSVVKNRNFSA